MKFEFSISLKYFLILIIILKFINSSHTINFDDEIYTQYSPFAAFRILDKTSIFGTTSPFKPSSGQLYLVETEADLTKLLNDNPSHTLVVVIDTAVYNKDNLEKLVDKLKLAGIIVIGGTIPATGFSPEKVYPDREADMCLHPNSDYIWNPYGTSLLYERFYIPIVYLLLETESEKMRELARANVESDKYPKNGADFQMFMEASIDSKVCLRRETCDPIGGESVWGFLGGVQNQSRPYILLQTSLDSRSFFPGFSPGGDFPSSGIVTLIAALDALLKFAANDTDAFYQSLQRDIMFAFWESESFGKVGSRKFISDVLSFTCDQWTNEWKTQCDDPKRSSMAFKSVNLSNIAFIVELGQTGLYDNISNYAFKSNGYLHYEYDNPENVPLSDSFINLTDFSNSQGLNISHLEKSDPATPGLPPSSAETFISLLGTQIPAILISDFNQNYTNKYYSSIFDNVQNLDLDQLQGIATATARIAYAEATQTLPENVPLEIVADQALISQLVDCFVGTTYCDLFQNFLGSISGTYFSSNYPGIYATDTISIHSKFIRDFITNSTNSTCDPNYCTTDEDCNSALQVCVNYACHSITAYFHPAYSNGVEYDPDNDKFNIVDFGLDHLWTESRWEGIELRSFQINNPSINAAMLVGGILLFLLYYFLIWIQKKKSFFF
ncbi:nicastrin [Anaeramoeba ignava]|uniref:Nicastrin n=1 Tax=Anaeramoeba ignava TaxID=1746090 RepID=A0A9Q0LK71_ANAIG|nr:nicastrin [Anaeramoeba ignava]